MRSVRTVRAVHARLAPLQPAGEVSCGRGDAAHAASPDGQRPGDGHGPGSEVGLLHYLAWKLRCSAPQRAVGLGHHQAARRLPVQAVDDARTSTPPRRGPSRGGAARSPASPGRVPPPGAPPAPPACPPPAARRPRGARRGERLRAGNRRHAGRHLDHAPTPPPGDAAAARRGFRSPHPPLGEQLLDRERLSAGRAGGQRPIHADTAGIHRGEGGAGASRCAASGGPPASAGRRGYQIFERTWPLPTDDDVHHRARSKKLVMVWTSWLTRLRVEVPPLVELILEDVEEVVLLDAP